MTVVVITRPEEIVTLERAKQHLRVDHDDDNDLIEAYIAAATAALDGPDGYLNRSLGAQTLELAVAAFGPSPTCPVRLPFGPVLSIESIKFLDPSGTEQTLPEEDYTLLSGDRVHPALDKVWPATRSYPEAVKVRYRAGHEGPVPPPIITAILIQVGDLYANRESAVTGTIAAAVPHSATVQALLEPYRVLSI